MMTQSVYKETLLEHYRHPKNRCDGPIQGADAVERGANPRCGDEVEVGILLRNDTLEKLQFRGRGCSICIASASMMTEAATGLQTRQGLLLCEQVRAWFGDQDEVPNDALPECLRPLELVREHTARTKCVLLSWTALANAIARASDQ